MYYSFCVTVVRLFATFKKYTVLTYLIESFDSYFVSGCSIFFKFKITTCKKKYLSVSMKFTSVDMENRSWTTE